MRNLLRTTTLTLLLLAIVGAYPTMAAINSPYSILVDPSMSEFKLGGEIFLVDTTEPVRVEFAGIHPTHVWGKVVPLDDHGGAMVSLTWVTNRGLYIPLHNGLLSGREWEFDSDDVTGHNEKFD